MESHASILSSDLRVRLHERGARPSDSAGRAYCSLSPSAYSMKRGIGRASAFLIGSGMGDVAILVARMVGPSGEVVGIERDASSIARAKTRVAEAD